MCRSTRWGCNLVDTTGLRSRTEAVASFATMMRFTPTPSVSYVLLPALAGALALCLASCQSRLDELEAGEGISSAAAGMGSEPAATSNNGGAPAIGTVGGEGGVGPEVPAGSSAGSAGAVVPMDAGAGGVNPGGGVAGADTGGMPASAGGPGALDECPMDPAKLAPGLCGCGEVDDPTDADGDGVADCVDECADDPNKSEPGECGCDVMEDTDDTDGDGVPRCLDACPEDIDKDEPGLCGCGVADDPTDTDGDGTVDCIDECPGDAAKTEPGDCGCGLAEDGPPGGPAFCTALASALVHRYAFDGNSATAFDTAGTAPGIFANGILGNTGTAVLQGGTTNQHIDLPDGILSSLGSVTLEAWLIWNGGAGAFKRIFDFGNSDGNVGTSYLFLTPTSGAALRAGFLVPGQPEIFVDGTAPLPIGALTQVALAFDAPSDRFELYIDGSSVGLQNVPYDLSQIVDVNNWLGRSQFVVDPYLDATLFDFRMYDRALSDAELQYSFSVGDEPAFL